MNFRNISLTLVCVILGIIITWQYRSIANNSITDSKENVRLETLKDDYIREKNSNEDFKKRISELEIQKNLIEQSGGNSSIIEKNLRDELKRARMASGLIAVTGKGLIVTLDNNNQNTVQEVDILNVINELRASDAQAISINEERLVAMSEIREAGSYIVINGRQMKAPFVIKAISDPEKLENALRLTEGVIDNLQQFYKIKVSITKINDLIIPKIDSSSIKTNLLFPIQD